MFSLEQSIAMAMMKTADKSGDNADKAM